MIILPAMLLSDLDWTEARQAALAAEAPILWEFDFGFNATQAPLFLSDRALFHAFVLAIEEFSKRLWKEFSSRTQGVVLYRGSLAIVHRIVTEGDEVEAAEVFGDYLHRLASFLPDDVTPYCLFESTPFSKGRTAQLTSKERFLHLNLSLEENLSKTGILLPPDELCTPAVLQKLEELMDREHRIIPELRLSEMWEGLDKLYTIPEAVTSQGRRHLKGFEAAGGEIFGAEGFEPPTHCSQSSCASQTALCSERGGS